MKISSQQTIGQSLEERFGKQSKIRKKKIIRIKGAGSKNLMLKDIILETAQIAFFSLSKHYPI